MSKKVVITRKPAPKKVTKTRKPSFPLGVPCNVKVKGERVMRKSVVLDPHPSDSSKFLVKTGRRGRPAFLPVESIEKVRAL